MNIIEKEFIQAEIDIINDIARRIIKTGSITRTADLQLEILLESGKSSKYIKRRMAQALKRSESEVERLFNEATLEYEAAEPLYNGKGKDFIHLSENVLLQQEIEAIKRQTLDELRNITQTTGFMHTVNGVRQYTPAASYFVGVMDRAMYTVQSGAFDLNSVTKKAVKEMTASGIRYVDYESGWHNRTPVAARRAVVTGITQVSGRIAEYNAEQLGTEQFEIDYHYAARPSHALWQGKVYTKEELVTICGLGTVTGLQGANCSHVYYPFIDGVSKRKYTDSWLKEQLKKENTPIEYNGKKYTAYEAKQKQRELETAMRAKREEISILKKNGISDTTEKIKYRGLCKKYKDFSDTINIKTHFERVYIDGLGRM